MLFTVQRITSLVQHYEKEDRLTDSDKPEYQYDAKTDTLTVRFNGTVDMADIEESYPRVKTLILEGGIRSIENSYKSEGELHNLTKVIIPDSVKSIGSDAFSWCTSLESIDVNPNNSKYSSKNGVLFDKTRTELIRYPAGKTDDRYDVPDSVESIGEDAFSGCTSLESVTIPDSVKSIGLYTFLGCSSLESVYCGSEYGFRWKSCFPDGVSFRVKTPEQPPIRKSDCSTSSLNSTLENILRQAFEHNNRIAENLPQFISVLKDLRAPGKIVVVLECFFKYEPEKYMIALVSKDDSKAYEVSLSIANEYGFSQDTVLNLITSIRNLFKKFD